ERLTIVASEFNAVDWFNHWANSNDLGHALVSFDMFGQMLAEPKLTFALYWNSRWLDPSQAYESLFFAFDDNNKLTAQGQAIAIWGQFLLD
ncbi:hypothetical protein ACSTKU_00380, partial [Vibrio parahaemolyticus]